MKSIHLKRNQIGIEGMKALAEAVCSHSGLISVDLRLNPCYNDKSSKIYRKAMTQHFYTNIREEVDYTRRFGNSRIKIDFVCPDALGLKNNRLDDFSSTDIATSHRREYFVELVQQIATKLEMDFQEVLRAFFGNNFNKLLSLKFQLNKVRNRRARTRGGYSAQKRRTSSPELVTQVNIDLPQAL